MSLEASALAKFALLTSATLDLVEALNKAALIINARHQRGGDYTTEELNQIDEALASSKVARDLAILRAGAPRTPS